MKLMKKVLAFAMAAAMILGMSMISFATENTHDDNVRVYGVEDEEGITVTAYQIIRYDEVGKYLPVIQGTIEEQEGILTPTADNVLALSERTDELETSVVLVEQGDYYTSTDPLAAGTWMILVTGSNEYIYNPAIVSVSQTPEGIEYGELNLDTDSWGTDVWAKKSEPTITKEVLTTDVTGVQYGDILQFQITTTIPSYAENKENIVYNISDTLEGLALIVDDEHPVNATLDDVEDATLTGFVEEAFVDRATDVTVALGDDDYIKANGNKEIVITYYAKVTEDAKLTVSEITNDANLEYSTGTGTSTKFDDTKHYTFGIDTSFSGSTVTENKTGEFIKIDENGNVAYTETPGEVSVTEGKALDGAVFELHIGSENGELFKDADGDTQFTTDETGRLEIVGLDSDVTYYLVEVKAPEGYTLNETPVSVKIDAIYDGEGNLTEYSVVFDGTVKTNYKYTDGTTTVAENVGNPYGFKNTELSSLPATGGIGTTIFTISGCVIMIVAASLFFVSRRKTESK